TLGGVQGWPGGVQGTLEGAQGTHGNAQGTPGGAQGTLGSVQGWPGGVQGTLGGAKRTLEGAQGTPGGAQGTPGSAQGIPGGIQGRPGGIQGRPGGVQGAPGGIQGRPGGVQGAPGGIQGRPGGVQGAPGGATQSSGMGTQWRPKNFPNLWNSLLRTMEKHNPTTKHGDSGAKCSRRSALNSPRFLRGFAVPSPRIWEEKETLSEILFLSRGEAGEGAGFWISAIPTLELSTPQKKIIPEKLFWALCKENSLPGAEDLPWEWEWDGVSPLRGEAAESWFSLEFLIHPELFLLPHPPIPITEQPLQTTPIPSFPEEIPVVDPISAIPRIPSRPFPGSHLGHSQDPVSAIPGIPSWPFPGSRLGHSQDPVSAIPGIPSRPFPGSCLGHSQDPVSAIPGIPSWPFPGSRLGHSQDPVSAIPRIPSQPFPGSHLSHSQDPVSAIPGILSQPFPESCLSHSWDPVSSWEHLDNPAGDPELPWNFTACVGMLGTGHFYSSLWDGTGAEIPLFSHFSSSADPGWPISTPTARPPSSPRPAACLGSYAGLIGECRELGSGMAFPTGISSRFDITPNYVDASTTSITISPWCSCKGSGNMEEERFPAPPLSPCFIIPILPKSLPPPGNAIQAFGNGTDVSLVPKNPNPAVTVLPKVEKSPALPDDVNDSNTAYDRSVISTCTSLQVRPRPSPPQTGSTGGAWDVGKCPARIPPRAGRIRALEMGFPCTDSLCLASPRLGAGIPWFLGKSGKSVLSCRARGLGVPVLFHGWKRNSGKRDLGNGRGCPRNSGKWDWGMPR
ncbi:hypothetical protein DV515_00019290, partial [Chloebia gouldiae]